MTVIEQVMKVFLEFFIKILTRINNRRFFRILFFIVHIFKGEIKMNNSLIIYFSKTNNTKKVALAIKNGLEKNGINVTIKKVNEVTEPEFYNYDLICFGSPVVHSLPPSPVLEFLKNNKITYLDKKEVYLPSPKLPNKNALIFVTYSGPHCGISEALPVGKYIRQFFEHLGFNILDEWYEVGEFHGWEQGSIKGLMGDIRGRPNAEDLALIELKTIQLTKSL
jgi:multimeric flavodoxin WrbA